MPRAAPGSGSVTLQLSAASQMAPGSYSIVISAAGGGVSQTLSLPVTVAPVCTYSINPKSAAVPASAGRYSISVTAPAGCAWTSSSAAAWITVTSGASGSGSGSISYSVTANSATTSRTGSLTVAGLSFAVTQAAATAAYTLSPTSASVSPSGGTGSIVVAVTPSTTAWTAASNASWITVMSGATGTGSRTVIWSAAANASSAARTGTITIGSATFTLTQAAQAAKCAYSISVGSITRASYGYAGSVAVIASTGCQWSASSNASWLTVTSRASGSGNGTVTFLAAFNTTKSTRNAVLTVAGYAITITETASTSPTLKAEPLPTDEL